MIAVNQMTFINCNAALANVYHTYSPSGLALPALNIAYASLKYKYIIGTPMTKRMNTQSPNPVSSTTLKTLVDPIPALIMMYRAARNGSVASHKRKFAAYVCKKPFGMNCGIKNVTTLMTACKKYCVP